ncbi:MAG: PspC domain-containing protein [Betaproteobacteria bacterium]|nr:PspC domain-containing protein [Betaproteobacteria bacterium]MDH5222167.1 PspC domain-containing protein [Betaproteobacteria bacterium]MDH5350981.1 PspC domain-containing protein [Betaproteobacteria bacterium]
MKRLHRSHEERKIAGVCAGLGEYFELDPVFFRLFFLFSILFGGLGAIAYAMLWILMPLREGAQPAGAAGRRLRLSAKERMIGGVCGGLGELFELDPILFRAAFLVLAFIGGLGILLYVVLWLLIPGPAAPGGTAQPDRS